MGTRAAQFDFLISGYIDPNTGLVGAGYGVYFYAAGTTTPKDVWTAYDKTGGAVQTATLDATGSVAIWGDGIYKVVIKNLSAATVDTYDGIKVQWPAENVTTTTAATLQITVDMDVILADPTSNNQTLTLPSAASCDHSITIKRIAGGANTLTILPTAPDTLDGAASYGISTLNQDVTWITDGATWYGKSVGTTNANTLAGYAADTTAVAATIPVRDANAKLAGSVLGYAETGSGGAYGLGYKGLRIVYTSATTVTVTADAITLSDGTNQRQLTAWNHTGVITTAGLGGLDTGAEAASTWYHIWAIAKADGTQGIVLSVSATAPTMPADYTFKRRVGAVKNDGSSNFVPFIQEMERTQFTAPPIQPGASTAGTAPSTFAALTLRAASGASAWLPLTARSAQGFVFANGSGIVTAAAPNNAYGAGTTETNPPPVYIIATGHQSFDFLLESNDIYWINNATTAGVYLLGYRDNI